MTRIQQLLETASRKETGLPVSTMTEAVVDGLKKRRRQAHRGRHRLCGRGQQTGLPISSASPASRFWRCAASACFGFGEPGSKSEKEIIELSGRRPSKRPEA